MKNAIEKKKTGKKEIKRPIRNDKYRRLGFVEVYPGKFVRVPSPPKVH